MNTINPTNVAMDNNTLRQDILAVMKARKIRLYRLAKESGVDSASLWRFMNDDKANLNSETLFRLLPHIYKELAPVLLIEDANINSLPQEVDA